MREKRRQDKATQNHLFLPHPLFSAQREGGRCMGHFQLFALNLKIVKAHIVKNY